MVMCVWLEVFLSLNIDPGKQWIKLWRALGNQKAWIGVGLNPAWLKGINEIFLSFFQSTRDKQILIESFFNCFDNVAILQITIVTILIKSQQNFIQYKMSM
jgi:hypothetical protein